MDAIIWAASVSGGRARGIRVINLSFAGFVDPARSDYSDTLNTFCAPFKAAADSGVAIVAAAGNYAMSIQGRCAHNEGCLITVACSQPLL